MKSEKHTPSHIHTTLIMTSTTPTGEITKILLLGAGELGTAFLPHISSLPNTHVTIGVRSPSKYTHLQTSIIDLAPIDLTSPSPALSQTFAAYNTIISATGFASSSGSVTKLAQEVLGAGRLREKKGQGRLWYFPWQWGVDYDVTLDGNGLMPLFGEQKAVRDLLRSEAEKSGVHWTVVSTGVFMSFLFEPFWGIVDRRKRKEEDGVEEEVAVRCLRDWEHGVTVTDVHDIGRVLKRILAGNVQAENRVVYVAGDTVTYNDVASIVEKVVGHQVVREKWNVEHLQGELRRDPEDGIKKYRLVFAGEGVYWEKEKTVNWELGMDMMGVEAYAKKVFAV